MSTRSVVAFPAGDTWRGRYCHSDGYPSHQLVELLKLVNRDGVETVRKRLTEDRYGWSYISSETDVETPLNDGRDRRFATEAGYGIAYTTEQDQSSPDEWIERTGPHDWGTEWAYVITTHDIIVLENRGDDPDPWVQVGRVRHDVTPDADLLADLECGKELERCGHVASYHFPNVTSRVGTAVYLGKESPRFYDAHGVTAAGKLYDLSGSGGQKYANGTSPNWREPVDTRRPRYWFASAVDSSGSERELRVARCTREGYKLELPVLVETVHGTVTIPAGTVLR